MAMAHDSKKPFVPWLHQSWAFCLKKIPKNVFIINHVPCLKMKQTFDIRKFYSVIILWKIQRGESSCQCNGC